MSSSGLVARDRELAAIEQLLLQARHGVGDALVLRGDPGTGKSALLQAAVGRATGFAVIQLRGTREDSGMAEQTTRRLLDQLSGVAVGSTRSASEQERNAETESSPGEVRDVVAAVLRDLVQKTGSPLLVAVDDCQWVPPAFVDSLVAAVLSEESPPVALILATRDLVAEAHSDRPFEEVDAYRLRGLTVEQAARMLELRGRGVSKLVTVKRMVEMTEGNPRALVDVSDQLTDDELDGWRPVREPAPIGSALAADLAESIADLPEETKSALVVAAAGGRVPWVVLEAALAEIGSGMDALEPALQKGIVAARRSRFEFTRPLIGAGIFRIATPEHRRRAHLALSNAFDSCGDVERSARHGAMGADGPSDRLMWRVSLAARMALDRGDIESAATYHETASEFATSTDGIARCLAAAARTWTSVGHVGRARWCLERAERTPVSQNTRAEILHQRALVEGDAGADPAVTAMHIQAAGLCEHDSPDRAVVMLCEGAVSAFSSGRSEDATSIATRAMQIALIVSSHAEALAGATLAAIRVLKGDDSQEQPPLGPNAALLMGQTEGFSGSAELGVILGLGLLRRYGVARAQVWSTWIERCASSTRDQHLFASALVVRATAALRDRQFAEAAEHADSARELAESCANQMMLARSLGLLVAADALRGRRQGAFAHFASLSAFSDTTLRGLRSAALCCLADLELQSGSTESAFAWLNAARECIDADPEGAEPRTITGLRGPERVTIEVMAHAFNGERAAIARSVQQIETLYQTGAVPAAWPDLVRALAEVDHDAAERHFEAALSHTTEDPWLAAMVEFWWGERLLEAGRLDAAHRLLLSSAAIFARIGASGWESLALSHSQRSQHHRSSGHHLPSTGGEQRPAEAEQRPPQAEQRTPLVERRPPARLADTAPNGAAPNVSTPNGAAQDWPAPSSWVPAPTEPAAANPDAAPDERQRGDRVPAAVEPDGLAEVTPKNAETRSRGMWRVELLGGFEVLLHDEAVALPPSLPSQALKIVALNGRISVDELVELLWPEAEPGVGTRRLRNVLFRLRGVCGDLLVRDTNFIRLSMEASTDVAEYRRVAQRALGGPTRGDDEPRRELAQRAVALYRGELLPGDRHADWTISARESLGSLHVQLLELLVSTAIETNVPNDALARLEQLIEVDPYEEKHYLTLARLQAGTGNRSRALTTLSRAQRALDDLGVGLSKDLSEFRRSLEHR